MDSTTIRLLIITLSVGCTVHVHTPDTVAEGSSQPAPGNSDRGAYRDGRFTSNQCVEALEAGLASIFAAPDENHDNPRVLNVGSVLVGTLLGEVADADPRVRARFAELLTDPNPKIRRAALRFIVAEDPSGWRPVLEGYIDGAAEPGERHIALGGLVGFQEPALLARVRAAAERELQAQRIPILEARILSAARDDQSRELVENIWAECPRRDPGDHAPSAARQRWDRCAEIAVYRHGLGGPAAPVRSALRDGLGSRRMGAARALEFVPPDVALPHLASALSRTEPEISAYLAAHVARTHGLHTHPDILAAMRRHATSGHGFVATVVYALPDDDPLAVRLLVALAQEEPSAPEHVAELIRRGSPEGYRLLSSLRLGAGNGDGYLGSRHSTAHQLRYLGDERVERYLNAQLASDERPTLRLAVALVLNQRARAAGETPLPISPLVIDALNDADPYARMLAGAACLLSAPPS